MKRRFRPDNAPRGRNITVEQEATLLPFLFELLKEQSKTSVKALLSRGQILVNQQVTTQFDTPLHAGDVVTISYNRRKVVFNNPLLNIIYEDDAVIVVNKREGLLSVSTAKVRERTAFHILSDYLKKSDPRNKLFVLHRLDRDTSGLMMFAKTRAIQEKMQSNWNEMITERTYVAVVEGRPEKNSDLITTQLKENAEARVYVVAEGGKDAITRYNLLRTNDKYSLLELNLETGRKNQIRAQMEYIGHPIAGDYKYGAETDPTGRLMLHAQRLYFIHPETGEEMRFDTRIPDSFKSLTSKNW
ncbi:MAG TPA: RluA family pseudouridine synthase [Candidatus Parabacteroides intestinavium]|nr:RluA family pseudouridine synthase [Candidatus Parabacteroides intestinavium]